MAEVVKPQQSKSQDQKSVLCKSQDRKSVLYKKIKTQEVRDQHEVVTEVVKPQQSKVLKNQARSSRKAAEEPLEDILDDSRKFFKT